MFMPDQNANTLLCGSADSPASSSKTSATRAESAAANVSRAVASDFNSCPFCRSTDRLSDWFVYSRFFKLLWNIKSTVRQLIFYVCWDIKHRKLSLGAWKILLRISYNSFKAGLKN